MSVPFLSFIFSSIYFLSFTVHSMNVSNKLHNWFLFIHLWRMIKAYCNLLWDWISLLYWPYFTLINSDTSIVYNNEFVWLLTSFSFDKYHQHINWSFDFNLLFVAQFWTIEFFECNHIRFTCFVKFEFNRECFLFPFFFTEFDNAYRLYCCNCNQYRSLLIISKAKGHPTASIQHIKVLVKDPTTTKYQLKQQNCFAESFFNSATWPKKRQVYFSKRNMEMNFDVDVFFSVSREFFTRRLFTQQPSTVDWSLFEFTLTDLKGYLCRKIKWKRKMRLKVDQSTCFYCLAAYKHPIDNQ